MDAAVIANFGWLNTSLACVIWALRLLRRPGVSELRVRLFEALSAAVRAGAPLAPVVSAAAAESNRMLRPALQRLADDLDRGTSLAAALGACRPLAVPAHVVRFLEGADGTPALAGALASAATDEIASRARRARPRADIAYVGFVLLLTTLICWFASTRIASLASMDDAETVTWLYFDDFFQPPPLAFAIAWFFLTLGLLASAVVQGVFPGGTDDRTVVRAIRSFMTVLPPFRTPIQLSGFARFFDAAAAHVGAGRPLAAAAREGGAASGVTPIAHAAIELAEAIDRGEPSVIAWDVMPLPVTLRTRAVAACTHAGTAAAFAALAADCRTRLDGWVEARARFVVPVGLLASGAGAAWVALALFGVIDAARRHAVGAAPW